MKKATREFLLNYMQTHYLNDEYTLHQLFYTKFAEMEFASLEDYLNGATEFFELFLSNKHLIKFREETIMPNRLTTLIENEQHNVLLGLSEHSIKKQKEFTDAVSMVFDNPDSKSILDVGPGHMPVSSFLLSKNFKKVTAMDSHFYLSQIALQNMNVVALSQYFTNQTPLSDYDFIVGRAPCEAIESIVENCAKNNKPYFIELCPCNVEYKYISNKDSFGWENLLPTIDPNIRFHGEFAYNLTNIPNNIFEALKGFIPKSQKYKKIYIPAMRKNNAKRTDLPPANEIEFD